MRCPSMPLQWIGRSHISKLCGLIRPSSVLSADSHRPSCMLPDPLSNHGSDNKPSTGLSTLWIIPNLYVFLLKLLLSPRWWLGAPSVIGVGSRHVHVLPRLRTPPARSDSIVYQPRFGLARAKKRGPATRANRTENFCA